MWTEGDEPFNSSPPCPLAILAASPHFMKADGLWTIQSWRDNTEGKRGHAGEGGEQGHLSDLNTEEVLAQDELCRTPAEAQHSSGM